MLCFANLLAGIPDKHGARALTPEQTTANTPSRPTPHTPNQNRRLAAAALVDARPGHEGIGHPPIGFVQSYKKKKIISKMTTTIIVA